MNFSEYVKGKRIAVVGPGPTTQGTNQGNIIDSYDIVMRFNSAVPVPTSAIADIGTRTDILCNCLEGKSESGGNITPMLWKKLGVKWVLSPYPKEISYIKQNYSLFESKNKGQLPVECTDLNNFEKVRKEIGTRPNTGFLGIIHLLNFELSELYITGITFGRGGYMRGYKDHISPEQYNRLSNSDIHQQKPQEDYFRKIYKTTNFIKVDPFLHKLMID
jgi:hypothetical protein